MITKKLFCEKYIEYIADSYIDFNGEKKTGLNNYNKAIDAFGLSTKCKIYETFSMGYQETWGEDYVIALLRQNDIDKKRGLIDSRGYYLANFLNVELRKTGELDTIYTMLNFLPEIFNNLAVDFFNQPAMKPYFDIKVNSKSSLSSTAKDSPNPFSTVRGVFVSQTISAALINNIEPIN